MATAPNPLNVVYRPQPAAQQQTSIHPLLELSLAQTNSQGAYLYRLDRDPDGLELAAWSAAGNHAPRRRTHWRRPEPQPAAHHVAAR